MGAAESLARRELRPPAPSVDLDAAARAIEDLLVALGEDPARDELVLTPRRAAEALAALVTPEPFVMTTFDNDGGYDEMVVVRDLTFRALCVQDLLPVTGIVHVGYLPGARIVGLSKFARLVDHQAASLQTQERFTKGIADALADALHPRGLGVVVEADHDCAAERAIASGARLVTTDLRGVVRDEPAARREFLDLVLRPRTGAGHQ
jgi:GTP cyclohydrolase IA